MKLKTCLATGLWVHQCFFVCLILANPDAKRLYDDLLSNYNRLIRPVSNHTEKVTVKLGLRLSQLVDLVSKLFTLGRARALVSLNFDHVLQKQRARL